MPPALQTPFPINGGPMAKKQNKKSVGKPYSARGAQVKGGRSGRSPRGDRGSSIALICFASLALVGLLVGIAALIISYVENREIDYLNDDLSRYIYLSEEDYKSFDVVVTVDPVTDMAVENKVLQALYKHRETITGEPKYYIDETVTPADKLLIYYRGYTLGENGEKYDFNGGSNFSDSSAYSLEIGSGSFVLGFELGLVGHNPKDYSGFKKVTTGTVSAGDVIQLTYSAAYPDGSTVVDAKAVVSLDKNACDKTFGEGFAEFLVGKPVGEVLMAEKKKPDDPDKEAAFVGTGAYGWDGDPVFTDMKIGAVYEVGDNPLTVEVLFPYDYSEPTLRSKTAYFDVYIAKAQLYDTPALNDAFITDTLKISAEELGKYEGATLVDKWKQSLREELEEEYTEAVNLQIEDALLNHYAKNAKVKRLPGGEVNDYYLNYVLSWEEEYSYYGGSYASLDDYVITQMGLNYYDDWRALLREEAEAAITDKLVFYYVAAKERLLPDAETLEIEKELLILEYLEAFLEEQGCNRSKYDSDEKYEAAVASYRAQLLYYYEDSYFAENATYNYVMKTLRAYANVTYANNK